MEERVPLSVTACSGWPACGDLKKVKYTSGPQEYAPGWEEHTHKQPQHPAVPREEQLCQSQVPSPVKGVSHSRGFCSLLGIALENTA